MTWATADYRTYPARCIQDHRRACAQPDEPHLIGTWAWYQNAQAEAALYRRFRYLVRSQPGKDFALDRMFKDYTFRTKIITNAFGDALLYLTARPINLSTLEAQFPDLARISP